MSRRAKAKVKRPSKRGKDNGPLGHAMESESESKSELESESRKPKRPKRQKWERQRVLSAMWQIRSPSSRMLVEQSAARISHSAINHVRAQGKFTISQSILGVNPFRFCSQINSEVFKTYGLQLNNLNSKVRVKHPTMGHRPLFCLTLAKYSVVVDATSITSLNP